MAERDGLIDAALSEVISLHGKLRRRRARGVADGAIATARRLHEMSQEDRARLADSGGMANSALRVLEALMARSILNLSAACEATRLTFPTVSAAMNQLVSLGIARELTGKQRNRLFAYDRYLAALREGTE